MKHEFFVWCAQQELRQYREDGKLLRLTALYRRIHIDNGSRKIRPDEVDPRLTEEWVWQELLRQVKRLQQAASRGDRAAIEDIDLISRHCLVPYELLGVEPAWIDTQFVTYSQQLYQELIATKSPGVACNLLTLRAHGNIPDFETVDPHARSLIIAVIRAHAEELKRGMRSGDFISAFELSELLHLINWANGKISTGLSERILGITEEAAGSIACQLQLIKLQGPGPLN